MTKNAKKLVRLVIFVLLPILLTGCWDRWEIENRGMVLGMGLDRADKPVDPGSPAARSERSIKATMQVGLPAEAAGSPGGGGASENAVPFWNLVTIATSLEGAVQEAASRIYRAPYFGFLQVLVLGEDLARDGLDGITDMLFRLSEVRRSALVYVAEGEALEVLELKPKFQPINAIYLGRLAENASQNAQMIPEKDLGDLSRALHEGRPFVLGRIIPGKDDAKLSGSAVFDGERLAGWLSETETEGYRWVTGQVKGGLLKTTIDGREVVFRIQNASTTIIPRLEEDRPVFKLKIKAEGSISEDQSLKSIEQPRVLEEIDQSLMQQLEALTVDTVQRVQETFGLDIFGFGKALERRYPAYWQEIEERWNGEIFPLVDVEVETEIFIRRAGLSR